MQINTGASSGGDETSPDMLKNTASNIRRLAGEIEQHAGRQKYLAQTRSPSDGGDVRWYFCKVPLTVNALAASVPHTEIVGKGDYFRFGMRDSLAVEASFLQREEELFCSWWKEYAECSEGPRGQPSITSSSTWQKNELSPDSPELIQLYAIEEDRVGVPVKGGLYEVDLTKRHCFPVYWNGENRRVLRGHWFARKGGLDWLPVREDVSEQLEYAYRCQVWHRRTFQESGLFAARVDLQGSSPGLHALFTGEDDTWEAWLKCDASGISRVMGFGGNTFKLRRGYAPSQSEKPTQDELHQQQEEEMDDYCSQVPVRHVVFMVHGIGQRLENSNLVDDVGDFRHLTSRLAERHLTSHQRGTQRVLFIPCQWRKGLALSGETAVEKITLDGVRGLRMMLGATVHDVLYYMSPIYCQHIIDSLLNVQGQNEKFPCPFLSIFREVILGLRGPVSNQLNKLYLKFLKRNPGYDGKVSLYGHSLGCVLSYDILCHQEALNLLCPTDRMHNEHQRTEASCSGNDNLSFGGNTISNSGDENSKNAEVLSIVGPVDNSNLIEDHVDGYPVSSESDGSTTTDIGYQLTNDGSSSCENEDKPSGSSNEIESYKSDSMNYPNSMTSEVLTCEDNKNDKGVCDTSKDQTIKLLREEIDLLKEKIKKFEAHCAEKEASVKQVHSRKTSTAVTLPDPESVQPGKQDISKGYTPLIRYTKLEFNVDTFFAVGSPLGVFLSLRNTRIGIGKGKHYWEDENINEEMPACRQMFNVFHPFDPVAYRIEPLICKEFMHERPIIIPYHRGGKRLYVGFQEFREGLASRSEAFVDQLNTVRVKVLTICESRCDDGQDEASEKTQEKQERTYGSVMMERLTGSQEGRIDHVLQDRTFRHPYLSAIGSHTNYWRDPDTSLFILNHLYRDIPDEPLSPSAQPEGSSKDKSSLESWSDPREVDDEELPLTFADSISIKKFSHRAKKVMRS